jgi:hypothetical protein
MTTKTTLELIAPPPPPEIATVDAVRADVEKLYEREQRASHRVLGLRREEADATMSAGVLDVVDWGADAAAVDLARRIGDLHAQAVLASRVVDAARLKRRAAIQALYVAEAAALRERSSAAQSEAVQHVQRVDALLAQLEQLEGVRYLPEQPPQRGVGVWADPRPGGWPMARSASLLLSAESFEQQALAQERRVVQDQGAAEATSQEDALAQLAALGPLVIGPPLVAVQDWMDEQFSIVADQRRRRSWLRDALVAVSLRWSDGELDRAQSRVVLVEQDV